MMVFLGGNRGGKPTRIRQQDCGEMAGGEWED